MYTTTLRVRIPRVLVVLASIAVLAGAGVVMPAAASRAAGWNDCSQAGGHPLGAAYSDAAVTVPTCGPLPLDTDGDTGPAVTAYPGSGVFEGYQCVEFSERYLYYRFGWTMGRWTNGAQVVDHYAAAYPQQSTVLTGGTEATAPQIGDVMSFSASAAFDDVGHTGVVIATSLDSAGNGTVRLAEQNYRGGTGREGYSDLAVQSWRVVLGSYGFAHVKWLRVSVPVPTPAPTQTGPNRKYLVYEQDSYFRYAFASPSGNIRCSIAQYEDSAPWGCYVAKRKWKDPKLPYVYATPCAKYGTSRLKGAVYAMWPGSGFYATCSGSSEDVRAKSRTLPRGSKLSVNGVTCTSGRSSGAESVTCVGPKGARLVVSKATVKVTQPKKWIP